MLVSFTCSSTTQIFCKNVVECHSSNMSLYKSISIHFIPLTLHSDHCVAFCEILHSASVAPLISPSDLSADGLSLKTASGHGERLGTNDSPPHAHTRGILTRGDTFAFRLFKSSRRRPKKARFNQEHSRDAALSTTSTHKCALTLVSRL